MNDKIENNPTVVLHNEIHSICSPLTKLGITYFGHANVIDNQFAGISNNPDFHMFYLRNKYQNADIHMANNGVKQEYFIWDDIVCAGKSAELDNQSLQFGINHTFTIYKKDELGDHFYHFATSEQNKDFNRVYLNNIDLLNIFINKFRITTYNSSSLSDAYAIRYSIDENQCNFDSFKTNDLLSSSENRKKFLLEIWKDKEFPLDNGSTLNLHQLLILYWLCNGKTINDISRILNRAEITVHKHINSLKEQINCYTQFQLGMFFSSLSADIREIIELIEKR